MTVDDIKDAITRLPTDERHALAAWLNDLGHDDWDREMAADFSPGGRGMAVVERVRREIALGKTVQFEEGLQQAEPGGDRSGR